MKLEVRNSTTSKDYTSTENFSGSYVNVGRSYVLPITTETMSGLQLKINDGQSTYRAMEYLSSSTSEFYNTTSQDPGNMSSVTALTRVSTSGTSYLTRVSTSDTVYLTRVSTSDTQYLTRSSTSSTQYLTRVSTSGTNYGTRASTSATLTRASTSATLTRASTSATYTRASTSATLTRASTSATLTRVSTSGYGTKTVVGGQSWNGILMTRYGTVNREQMCMYTLESGMGQLSSSSQLAVVALTPYPVATYTYAFTKNNAVMSRTIYSASYGVVTSRSETFGGNTYHYGYTSYGHPVRHGMWSYFTNGCNITCQYDTKTSANYFKLFVQSKANTNLTSSYEEGVTLSVSVVTQTTATLTRSSISGYGTRTSASGYQTRQSISGYGTRTSASGYQTRSSISGYGTRVSTSGTTYLTRASTSVTNYLTCISTSDTSYLTRVSTSDTVYLTRESTSETVYLTCESTSGYSGVSSSSTSVTAWI